jgi:hypothetical protein
MNQSSAIRFTDAELESAKNTDLPNLLSSLGYHITVKGRYHSTTEMDSLRIKSRKTWFRYSEQVGGDAITFLQHFHNMSFPDAVKYLLAFNGHSRDAPAALPKHTHDPPEEPVKQEFSLPPPSADNRRVFAYLLKRGIAKQVVGAFLSSGLLYEDTPYHNCIFVGKNASDEAVFANKRGTYDQDGFSFKGDVPGSDKAIAFRLSCDPDIDTIHVFEAPIDLMSYMSLRRDLTSNAVALCCLHDGALGTYLNENPHIKRIVLCLDNDKWAQEAILRIRGKYEPQGYTVTTDLPTCGKDWNEHLQARKEKIKNKER